MKQVDWAKLEVEKLAGAGPGVKLIDAHSAMKLLRSERLRTRRICRKKAKDISNSFINNDEILAYRMACDDIEKAIVTPMTSPARMR